MIGHLHVHIFSKGPLMYGIVNAAKQLSEPIATMLVKWKIGEPVSKQQGSRRIQQYLKAHLQKVFPHHEFFPLSMKLFVRMIVNGTHWFSVLKQPMMIIIWCRDWEEASKLIQYLMQILQVNFDDYIPRCQIFVEQEEDVNKLVQHWMSPSTKWQGRPVIGFMAETCLSDLETAGFKHFNPMWSFPTTSVYQNWEPLTFGMSPWHLVDDTEHAKDALVS